jgi:hypothetical protein
MMFCLNFTVIVPSQVACSSMSTPLNIRWTFTWEQHPQDLGVEEIRAYLSYPVIVLPIVQSHRLEAEIEPVDEVDNTTLNY